MKIRTLILASAVLASATGYAFAQSGGSPTERAGSKAPDTSSTDTMSKDTMAKDKSGTTGAPTERTGSKAPDTSSTDTMSKDTMAKDKMHSGTTGAGTTANEASGKSNGQQSNPTVSPASPNAGEKQQK